MARHTRLATAFALRKRISPREPAGIRQHQRKARSARPTIALLNAPQRRRVPVGEVVGSDAFIAWWRWAKTCLSGIRSSPVASARLRHAATVHQAGISARGRVTASEKNVPDEKLPDYVVCWPGKWTKGARARVVKGN